MPRKKFLAPLRPLLHMARMFAQRALGLSSIVQAHNSSVRQVGPLRTNEIYQRILDRVCLLESHVNWRLLGLPSQMGNIRLEQAAALSHHQDLASIIRAVAEQTYDAAESRHVREGLSRAESALIVGSYNLFGKVLDWGHDLSKCTILQDPDDLVSIAWDANKATQKGAVTAGLLAYLLSLDDASLDYLWLGNSLQRSSPLHRLLILKNVLRILKKQGHASGIQTARNDIQFQVEMDWASVEAVGIPTRTVKVRDGFYTITNTY